MRNCSRSPMASSRCCIRASTFFLSGAFSTRWASRPTWVLSHPPYHNIVIYSGNEQGRGAHPDDLSRCVSEDELLNKLTITLKNQRDATRAGGYYGAIIGDVRKRGVYSSYQADLIVRMSR